MQRRILTIALCLFAAGAGADDFKIIQLEQDMRNLEREVQNLTRELEQLRTRVARGAEQQRLGGADREVGLKPDRQDWLSAASWDRVQTGMSELEVISLLGPPASMRVEDDARVLLYAMEIGAAGFLSGSVTIRDQKVAEVERPVLK